MTLPIILSVVYWPVLVLGGVARDMIEPYVKPGFTEGQTDCNLSCPTTMDYHCGTNGVTYDTECDLLNAICKDPIIELSHKGWCARFPQVIPSSCPETWTCLDEYEPVCSTDDETYDNMCFLTIANCRYPSTNLAHYGVCESDKCIFRRCDHIPTLYVCGSDDQIYRNLCELRNARCTNSKLIKVACPTPKKVERKCSEVCPLEYDPMCGTNDKSYVNKCHLDIHICRDPSITLLHDGPCMSSGKTKCEPCSGSESEDCICGSDGVSYRSPCAFNYALCMQSCPKTLMLRGIGKCTCSEDCTLEPTDPVCGSDGETYETACEFRVASCNDPGITLDMTGGCQKRKE